MSRFKPGDRVRSEYMSWKRGVVVADKRGKFHKEGNSGPSLFIQTDDDGRQVWWAERDLLPEE